jgi:hypothetical protein
MPSCAAERRTKIPDLLVQGAFPPQYCVARVDLVDTNFVNRKDRIIGYIRDFYTRSGGWKSNYSMIGVDYIDFLYFHLASDASCESLQQKMDGLKDFFQQCGGQKAGGCERVSLEITFDPHSDLVRKIEGPLAPIAVFESFRGREDLQRCTIKITADIPIDVPELLKFRGELDLIMLKYRMPILDIFQVNKNDLYILLYEECYYKEYLLGLMQELLDGEGFDLNRYIRSVELSPNIAEYRYSELGRQ